MRAGETRWAYGLLIPWIVGLVVFQAGPTIASAVLSLTDYDLIGALEFVGVEDYATMAADPKVARAVGNALLHTVVHVPLSFLPALGPALLPNRVTGRAAGVFRTSFHLPSTTPYAAQNTGLFTPLRGPKAMVDRSCQGGHPQWEIVLAASVVTTLPLIVIFFLGQRHFPQGIAITGRR